MPTYCGIGGVVRKLKEWPVGIDGILRQQKEVWAGVDGVNRKIFSSAPEFVYFTMTGTTNNLGGITIDGIRYTHSQTYPVEILYGTTVYCDTRVYSTSRDGVFVDGVRKGDSYQFQAENDMDVVFEAHTYSSGGPVPNFGSAIKLTTK